MKNNEKKLSKQLTPMHVWAIAFGCIIGWGSFINPGKKFLPNSGVAGTAIAMLLGALVMIIISYSYAYMVRKYPEAGGEFTFTKKCFGKKLAYICGWFLVAAYLTNVPMNSTAIGLIVDGLDGGANILKFGFHYQIAGFSVYMGEMLFAMAILVIFGVLNIMGVKKAAVIQTILASLLGLCAGTLFVSGLVYAIKNGIDFRLIWGFDKSGFLASGESIASVDKFAHVGTQGILSAVLATFAIAPWAFVGFDTIPQATEEFNFPLKKVIKIMIIAIAFGLFVYVSNNTFVALILKDWPEGAINGEWVLLLAAEKLLGTFGKVLIGVGVSCAVLSGIMGFYLASSRLMYSMSRDGYLPKWFGVIHSKYQTPVNAMIFCILISLLGPILGREALGWFVDMSAIGASIGYFFTCASTLKILKEDKEPSKKLKVLSLMGIIFSVSFMILQLIPIPGLNGVHFGKESYIMLIIWILIGFAFYLNQRKFFHN